MAIAQHSSSPCGIGSVQSRVGQPWESDLPWPGVHSELKDMDGELQSWVGQGEAGNPWISWNALWVLSQVRTVFWESRKYFLESCQVFCPEEKIGLTSRRKFHYAFTEIF